MNNEELKKIVEETIGNNDPYWNEPVFNIVKKIIDLPENTESAISELVDSDNKTDNKFMFEINKSVTEVCEKINIILDKSKHNGQFIGLPFNISFIKKTLSDDIINTIPESLKEYVYVHNGDIYAKQKLPTELEHEYEVFKRKLKQPKCPNCGEPLTFLMPDGKVLNCNKCNKCFKNNNGKVGEETSSPYNRNDVLY